MSSLNSGHSGSCGPSVDVVVLVVVVVVTMPSLKLYICWNIAAARAVESSTTQSTIAAALVCEQEPTLVRLAPPQRATMAVLAEARAFDTLPRGSAFTQLSVS